MDHILEGKGLDHGTELPHTPPPPAPLSEAGGTVFIKDSMIYTKKLSPTLTHLIAYEKCIMADSW